MSLLGRIFAITIAIVGVAGVAGALVVSHDAPCPEGEPAAASPDTMRSVVHRCFGPPEVVRIDNLPKPVPADDDVLVRVEAAAVNPLDWHYLRGKPYLMRLAGAGIGSPASPQLGVDFAGTVEAVGGKVTRFKPGDRVFGGRNGAFSEYLTVRESRAIAHIPAGVDTEQAAAMPIAAITALQALRDQGHLQPGQKVLVNGASGGVGTFAVQIARHMGAEVTGVCSTRNVDMVLELGASHVVDYTREDFTTGDARYDLVIDMVGNRGLLEIRRVMAPEGIYVMIGGPSEGNWLGPLAGALKGPALSMFTGQQFRMFISEFRQEDLEALATMMDTGSLRAVIDRRYPMTQAADAIAYLEEGHTRGKVILTW